MIWMQKPLGQLAQMKYGKMPPQKILAEEGYPIFSGYRVTGYATEYLYEGPRVVVVARGVGGTGDVKMSPSNSWITNLCIVLEPNSEVDPNFLYYRLSVEPLKLRLDTGAAQSQITIESLRPYPVSVPSFSIQRRIAAILSAYDDLIENNRRRIQLLEQAARLIYQEWFVRLRFPGHERVRVVDGVPEGWEKTRLSQVATVNQEQLKSSHRGVIEYVDISSVSPGSIDATQSFV